MKKLSRANKQALWGILISIGMIVSLYTFLYIAFSDVEVVCGKVIGETHYKGSSLIYEYKGERHRGSFPASGGLSSHWNSYENRCVDIEVSTMFPLMSRLKKYKERKH